MVCVVLFADHTGRIWCAETGSCILQYVGHSGSVNSIRFHPTQDVVVTSSGDQKVHLWKAQFMALHQELLVCYTWWLSLLNFYCATLCISMVLSVGRCLSTRPSVAFLYFIQIAKDIIRFLSWPGRPIEPIVCTKNWLIK